MGTSMILLGALIFATLTVGSLAELSSTAASADALGFG
jgi:hypothetical protein